MKYKKLHKPKNILVFLILNLVKKDFESSK